jgi:hypothetical protein
VVTTLRAPPRPPVSLVEQAVRRGWAQRGPNVREGVANDGHSEVGPTRLQ